MWTRAELKERAKGRIRPNYWRLVLVSLIMLVIAGGTGFGGQITKEFNVTNIFSGSTDNNQYHDDYYDDDDNDDFDEYDEYYDDYGNDLEHEFKNDFQEFQNDFTSNSANFVFVALAAVIFMVIGLIVFAILFLLKCVLLNPLAVGCSRFFVLTLTTDADIKEVCYTYDKDFKNGVKIMFFRDLYTFLWSLLFIIPGIIKSYEYRMIPYLLAENPHMDKETAFSLSRQMMTGNKWSAFVLDLSFILWYLLSALTCGILSIFYVNPYVNLTDAALYLKLKEGLGNAPEHAASADSAATTFASSDSINPNSGLDTVIDASYSEILSDDESAAAVSKDSQAVSKESTDKDITAQ